MIRNLRMRGLFLAAALSVPSACAQNDFSSIDQIVNHAVDEHQLPGAVVVVGHDGHVVFRSAYGMRSLEPTQEPMTPDTIFDMASLTKPLATAVAVMQLYEQGKIGLNDPVAKYLPEFGANGKQDITIRHLLTHYSGLPPDLPLDEPWTGKDKGYQIAFGIAPLRPPGEQFLYSDINFIVLGALVEKLSGLTLDEYVKRYIMDPLGLAHTQFLPPASWIPRIAPTEYEHDPISSGVPKSRTYPGDVMLRGVVHDPTSRRMGGVAGHAGLFSTADDLAIYAQSLLDRLAGRLQQVSSVAHRAAENGRARTARHGHSTAWIRLGHRLAVFEQSRHPLSRWLLRPHGIHGHLPVDRSSQRQLCDRAGKFGPSAWAKEHYVPPRQNRRCGSRCTRHPCGRRRAGCAHHRL